MEIADLKDQELIYKKSEQLTKVIILLKGKMRKVLKRV